MDSLGYEKAVPKVARHAVNMLLIMFGWVIFYFTDFGRLGQAFAAMFGFAGLPLVSAETLYYLRSYAGVFLLGLIGATPWPKQLALKKEMPLVDAVVMAALLLLCTASLVDGSFNPFLYFRF